MIRLRTKTTLWRHDRMPGAGMRLFCRNKNLEQDSLACPIGYLLLSYGTMFKWQISCFNWCQYYHVFYLTCTTMSWFYNRVMASVNGLQSIINACSTYGVEHCLQFNTSKSVCTKIGNKWSSETMAMTLNMGWQGKVSWWRCCVFVWSKPVCGLWYHQEKVLSSLQQHIL